MKAGEALERHAAGFSLAIAMLVALGVGAYLSLPRALYPELSFPRLVVVATAPNTATELVLRNVTRPLEEALAPVPGVRRVRSRTIRGAVELSLLFDPETDMVVSLQLVQARLAEARGDLPANVTLSAERITPTSFPVFTLNVEGGLPPERLREIALHVVRPALSRVPGVGPVTVVAGAQREIEVVIDPARAEAVGLTAAEAARRLAESTQVRTVGRVDRGYRRYAILVDPGTHGEAALGDVVVGGSALMPVRLSDVARIEPGGDNPRLVVRGPRGEVAQVNVARRIGADLIALDDALVAATRALDRELPAGVRVEIVYRQATIVGAATAAVRDAILVGALMAAIVLWLFLRDRRATLLSALAIPASLAIGCVAIRVAHGSLNLMSLGGLAIAVGLAIDDAVVVVEAIHRQRALGAPAPEAVRRALAEVALPVVTSTITTVVVFAPLALIEGVVGAFFGALALALAAAVIGSLAIALTVVPLLTARFAATSEGQGPASAPGATRLARLLSRALSVPPRRVLVAAAIASALGVVVASRLETGFIPELDEGAYVLDYFTPSGTSLAEADALATRLDDMLRADPAVATFTRRLGAELGPPAATVASRGDVIVRLKDRDRRSVFDVLDDQRAEAAVRLPGVRTEFVQLLTDMLGDLEGAPEPIEVKVFGESEPELRRQAKRVADAVAGVRGLADLYDGQVACSPERIVRLDPTAAGRLGLTAAAVAEQLQGLLAGAEAAPLAEGDRLIPVRVRWPDAARFDEAALDRVRLETPGGSPVPLAAVATIVDGCAPAEITRENLRPMVAVTAQLDHRDLGGAVRDVEDRLARLDLPRGYSFEIGGRRVAQRSSFQELALALAGAVSLVLLVLVFQFRSFAAPVAILAATPLSLCAGALALLVTRTPLNVSSLLGAILLVGLVVKNGILLLHHAAAREDEGLDTARALAEAAHARLRPIAMTTLCTLAGLLPLALGLGAGAELHRPLAVCVLGGLALGAPSTLLLTPALYRMLRRPSARPRPLA